MISRISVPMSWPGPASLIVVGALGVVRVERTAPYDLVGGSAANANAYSLAALKPGRHTVTAKASFAGGQVSAATAAFTYTP
jgi:hypothetical protein